ncbi:MAG TPA: PepSY-associated TM helix domain-containing protein [Sphingomicrobium sp.]|nr:PepSY-associated TM helix domain-containing protein [Sphingomicrobium sp.]
MKLLSFLHRWAGGFLGLLLAVLGLSGTILLWEGEWISLPGAGDPVAENVQTLGRIAEREAAAGAIRITFASEELGLHHVAREGGAGAYVNQAGATVASWQRQWQRPELWLFDLHHHLFAGEAGETITGIAGIAGLIFTITGIILWWRSRRAFKWQLWPKKFRPGPIVSHHRDIGILVAPLLLVSFLTGAGMLFPATTRVVLSPFGSLESRSKPPEVEPIPGPAPVAAMLAEAKARFPHAELRRLTLPAKPGQPWSVRLRQPFEWTSNGRTTLFFDGSGKLLKVDDPAGGSAADSINEKLYPVHSAKAGGLGWKLAMTLSGLGLTLLGALATWSFWFRKARKRRRPDIAKAGLEVAGA